VIFRSCHCRPWHKKDYIPKPQSAPEFRELNNFCYIPSHQIKFMAALPRWPYLSPLSVLFTGRPLTP